MPSLITKRRIITQCYRREGCAKRKCAKKTGNIDENYSTGQGRTLIWHLNKLDCDPLAASKIEHQRLFSHESKVCNLNDHSNCAIWITQCTHERICGLAFQSGRRCVARVWVPCQSNMHEARVSSASVHMKRAVYGRMWFEGHVAPPPPKKKKKKKNYDLEVKAFIRQFRCIIWEMRHWKSPPDHHLNFAIQITHRNVILRTHGPKYRHSNDHSNCAVPLCSRVKTVKCTRAPVEFFCSPKKTDSCLNSLVGFTWYLLNLKIRSKTSSTIRLLIVSD